MFSKYLITVYMFSTTCSIIGSFYTCRLECVYHFRSSEHIYLQHNFNSRAVFAGTVLIIFGLIWTYKGYKLPLEEAIELIHGRSQGITESEIVHEMMVDKITARRILNALVQKGFIRPSSSQAGQAEEVYDAVK